MWTQKSWSPYTAPGLLNASTRASIAASQATTAPTGQRSAADSLCSLRTSTTHATVAATMSPSATGETVQLVRTLVTLGT